MLNNSGPRYKRSRLERALNRDVIFCVVLLFAMCLVGAVGTYVTAMMLTEDADQTVLGVV